MISSARRMAALVAPAAAVAVMLVPGTALASKGPTTDRGAQCSGESIAGRGSTFQTPAQIVWAPGFNKEGKNSCTGVGAPTAEYRNKESADRGSGACLKAFGAEKATPNREYSFCGTDEAPNEKQKGEIESFKSGGEGESLLTIPVLQGSVAIIVHLPEGCKGSAVGVINKKTYSESKPLGRIVLDDATIDGIYKGTINTWAEVLTHQKNDKITCANESELETEIKRVVRTDHSGTTHIFKAFLSLVDTAPILMEEYKEAYGEGSAKSGTGCGAVFPEESKTWAEVSEACPNQRWPEAAHVIRNQTETGNPGVINLVNSTPSSVGYADLAVAREKLFFSSPESGGGEVKKGEQHAKFWVPVQNSSSPEGTYADPASKGDNPTLASSNCKNTKYIESGEKVFPPSGVRALWNQAKAALTEEHYSICGLTYDIAYREYKPYTFSKGVATTAHDYLLYELTGGQKAIKNKDYEALPKEVIKKAEAGIAEIGWELP